MMAEIPDVSFWIIHEQIIRNDLSGYGDCCHSKKVI